MKPFLRIPTTIRSALRSPRERNNRLGRLADRADDLGRDAAPFEEAPRLLQALAPVTLRLRLLAVFRWDDVGDDECGAEGLGELRSP